MGKYYNYFHFIIRKLKLQKIKKPVLSCTAGKW